MTTPPPACAADPFDLASAISDERLDLCRFLEDLDEGDWRSDSLCAGWTVRHVVAHLTLTTREGWWDIIKGAIAARGDFDRMTADAARDHAEHHSPTELVAQLRKSAGETRRTPMSSPLDPLADLLVHGQDMARPLGRPRPLPPDRTRPALAHLVASRWYGGAKRFDGLHLIATDSGWSHGEGADEVRGTMGDLLMVAAGRPGAVVGLEGAGVAVLSTRLGWSEAVA